MSRNQRGWLLTSECEHKLLLYMVVSASAELKKYGNVVILCIICKHTLFLHAMRYNCVVRFSDGYRG